MTTSTLLLILCIPIKLTTTSCSKVPQGLHFPLGVPGLCTRQYFQRAQNWDSDNLVKPFMHVAIQTTRHYAHFIILNSSIEQNSTLYIAIKFGLYLNNYFINYFWRVVSEDSRIILLNVPNCYLNPYQ